MLKIIVTNSPALPITLSKSQGQHVLNAVDGLRGVVFIGRLVASWGGRGCSG